MKQVARYLIAALLVTGCGSKSANEAVQADFSSTNMNMSMAAKAYAELVGPQIVVIGETATFSVVGATGMTITNTEWNMGDGSNRVSILTGSVTHTFKSLGKFTVTAMVFDDTGNGTLLSQVVNVIDNYDGMSCITETTVTSPVEAQTGTPVNVSAQIPSCLSKYVRSIRWSFGDGSAQVAGPTAQNTYMIAGTYTITAEIYVSWISTGPFLVLTEPIHIYDPGPVPTPTPAPSATPAPTPAPTATPHPLACPTSGATRVKSGETYTQAETCGLDGTKTVTWHNEITETCQSNGAELLWTETSSKEVKDSETACMGQSCQLADGSKLADGMSRTMYSTMRPDGACADVAQTRTCNNGVLGGSTSYSHFTCTSGCPGFGADGTTKIGVITGTTTAPVTCQFGETGVTSSYDQLSDQTCSDGKVVTSNTRQGNVKVAGLCPTYQWTPSDSWTECSAACGGQQSRVFECRNDKNEASPAERCTGAVPTETRVCDGNPESVKRTEVVKSEEDGSSSTACPANQIGVIVNTREVTTTKTYACIDHSVQLATTTVEKGPWVQEKYCRDYVAHRCSQDSLSNSESFGRYKWMEKCRAEVPAIDDFMTMLEEAHKEAKSGTRNVYPTFMNTATKPEKPWIAPKSDKANCDVPKTAYIAAVCLSSCATPEQEILAQAKANSKMTRTPFQQALEGNYAFVGTLNSHSSMSSKELQKTKVDQWVTELIDSDHVIIEFRTASGGLLRMTPNHPIIAADGTMKLAENFKVGDSLVKLGGSLDEITSMTAVHYFGKVYNVFVHSADPAQNVVVTQGYLNGTAFFQNEGATNLNRTIFRQNLTKGAVK